MCGIAGRFNPAGLQPNPGWTSRAAALLAHRGPDGEGHFADGYTELVHRRLALIDLTSTGRQPLPNEDGTVQVVFNGEIYNHHELRVELQKRGHRFRGTSDTEVLVHGYEEYGEDLPTHLKGMFAFAIYDQPRRRLFLCRDRFGIKPLYYARYGGEIAFASEMKAILALPDFRPVVDTQACFDYLGLSYIPEPQTGFTNISLLPKASIMVEDSRGNRIACYWKLQTEPNPAWSVAGATESVAQALTSAVNSYSVADVPVAALLSGGIDSSLVVAAYSRLSATPMRSFSVQFADDDYDESGVASVVSDHCGTQHTVISLERASLTPETVCGLLNHFDQPFADTSLFPMYSVAQAVKSRGLICTLSGDGGDEVFGGYARYWRINKLINLMRVPDPLLRTGRQLLRHTVGWTRDISRRLGKAIRLAENGRTDAPGLLAALSNYLSEEQKGELVTLPAREQLQPVCRRFDHGGPRGFSSLEDLSTRMTGNLFEVGLPSDMLRKVDMMSMLAGIEVRVPMLDETVAALGVSFPHRLKSDGARGKLVPRGLCKRWLPPAVANHRKHGFSIPLDTVVTKRFHEMLGDVLLAGEARTRDVFRRSVVEGWLKLFRQAHGGHKGGALSREGLYQRVFIILSLELWLRTHKLSWR